MASLSKASFNVYPFTDPQRVLVERMIEKRTNSRVRTLRSASIIFGGASTVDCVVRNLSETGACLEAASPVGIPDDFALQIKPEERKRDCHVAWRSANRIGVSFS